MKFGVREICNVVFKAKNTMKIGSSTFNAGQPVIYIDTATTSTLEGASTTVYAQGGRGNTRLIAWEGEKTLTYTVEDALLSPIGFSILSGAGVLGGDSTSTGKVHVHKSANALVDASGKIDLSEALRWSMVGSTMTPEEICETAPIFVLEAEADGSIKGGAPITVTEVDTAKGTLKVDGTNKGKNVFVDFYVIRDEQVVTELQITADTFSGNFYVEADTLFRDQATGKDMPAQITLPNVKIQSNFTFSMAATGDPSTFTFTMDAFPGYTEFDKTKKVLCVIQVVNDTSSLEPERKSVMAHETNESDTTSGYTIKDDAGKRFEDSLKDKSYPKA